MPESPDERSTSRGLFEADVKQRLSRTEEGSYVIKNLASLAVGGRVCQKLSMSRWIISYSFQDSWATII